MKKFLIISILFLFFLPSLVFAVDYTDDCIPTGSAGCQVSLWCSTYEDCQANWCDHCVCPDPIPNSHQVADTCAYGLGVFNCACIDNVCSGTAYCEGVGVCDFECDEGYEYIGEECVLPSGNGGIFTIGGAEIGGMIEYTGKLFTDLEILIILAIGLPLAFFVIFQIIRISKTEKSKRKFGWLTGGGFEKDPRGKLDKKDWL